MPGQINRLNLKRFAIVILLTLAACSNRSLTFTSALKYSITGKVAPLILQQSTSSTSGEPTALACTSAQASLYTLSSAGVKVLPAVQTVNIDASGSYAFNDVRNAGIQVNTAANSISGAYLVEITGCSKAYSRILTGFDSQDVTYGSTVVSSVAQTTQASAVATADHDAVGELINSLSTYADAASAYTALTSNTPLATQFQTIFGASPTTLVDAAPTAVSFSVPSSTSEHASIPLSVTSSQWSSSYTYAYSWKLDGVVISTSATPTWIPSGNSQGAHSLSVSYGQSNGSGQLDLTKPYGTKSFPIFISNNILPVAPLYSIDGGLTLTSVHLNLLFATGTNLQNCDSFSKFAITQDDPVPPLASSSYSLLCTQAPIQTVPFTLTGVPGIHVLRVWAQDASGVISTTPQAVTIDSSTAVPLLAFTMPVANSFVNLANQNSFTVAGTCLRADTVVLAVASISTTVNCTSGLFTAIFDLHTLVDGNYTVTGNSTDSVGNSAIPISVAIVKDTSIPVAMLSGVPSSPSRAVSIDSVISGANVAFYKFKIGAASGIDCSVATGYSAEAAVSAHLTADISGLSDAGLRICVVGRNLAGNYQNFSSATVANWVKDTVVTDFSSLAITPTSPGKNTKPTFTGASEASSIVQVYSNAACLGLVIGNATANASGGFSITAGSSIGADGNYNFSVQSTDLAGNVRCSSTSIAYTLDTVAPTVVLASSATASTKESPIAFTATFSEPVSGLSLSAISVTNGAASALSGSGANYTFNVTPAGQGAVSVAILGNQANDAALNSNTASTTISRIFDTVAPVLTIATPATASYTKLGSVVLSGACETGLLVNVGGTGLSTIGTTPCASSTFSTTVSFSAGDGSKNMTVSQTDAAGNVANAAVTVTFDTTSPVLTFTSASIQAQSSSTNTVTFSGSCESSLSIAVGITDSATATCTSGAWTYTTASVAADALRNYTFTQTDQAGNATTITGSWLRDSTPPTVSLTSLNSAALYKGGAVQAITWTASDTNLVTNPISLDYSTNGGTTWLSIVTGLANSGSYSWTLPSVNSSSVKVRVSAKDPVNTSTAVSSTAFTIDSSAPVVTLTSLNSGGLFKGAATQTVTWTASDANFGVNPITLSYTTDGGTTWTAIGSALANSGSYTWALPSIDSLSVKLRVTATDAVSQSSSASSSNVFGIDSTAPNLSLTTLNGGQVIAGNGATRTITWTGSDANFGANPISLAYSADSGSTWTPIASAITNSGSYNWTVSVADGTSYRLKVTAVDSVGNQSVSASTSNFTITSSAPNLTQTAASPAVTAALNSVTFGGVCDLSATMSTTTITVGGTDTATAVCTGTAPAGSWSYTTVSRTTDGNRSYTFSQTNTAAITSTINAVWVRDSVAPNVTAVSINSGDAYLHTTTAAVSVTAQDALYNAGLQVRVAAGTSAVSGATDVDCQALYANNSWQSQTNATTSYLLQVPDGDGYKKICAWAKDAAGNVSVISPSVGTSGTNMSVIQYANAAPPQITSFAAVNASNATTTYASGDLVKVTWSMTDALGLDNNPVKLEYTTNGSTWTTIESAYGSLSGNPTSYSTTYLGFSAPSAAYFQLRITAKNLTGQTSIVATSQAQNSGAWSIYAGTTSRGVGGTARSAVFRKNDGNRKKSFAFDPLNGDLYAYDDTVGGLMKVDAKTGIVSQFIAYGSTNLPTNGSLPASPQLAANPGLVAFDSNRLMYVMEGTTGRTGSSSKIFQINLATNTVKLYLGASSVATAKNDSTATPSTVWINDTDFDFDESNTMYFFTSCQMGGTWDASTLTTRMMKATQDSSGNASAVSVVAGDCVKGAPASGSLATSTHLSTNGDNLFYSLAVWGNGANIYFSSGGGEGFYKIVGGYIYSTAIPSGAGLIYSKTDLSLYLINGGTQIFQYSPSLSGPSGEVKTATIVNSGGTGNCNAEGVVASATCMSFYGNLGLTKQGKLYFGIGGANAASRIGYVNSAGNIAIAAGTLPFYGSGLTKDLMRGSFAGIYYKQPSELNQSSFPSGFYFMESSGVVFGYVDPSGNVSTVVGSQTGISTSLPTTGTPANSSFTLGQSISAAGRPMVFDGQGLPWLMANFSGSGSVAFSIDANLKFVRRQLGTTLWDYATPGVAATSTSMYVAGGEQNFNVKNQTLFLFGRYYSLPGSTSQTPVLRGLDFTANTLNHLMGSGTTASADTTAPGSLSTLSFSGTCYNYSCSSQFMEGNSSITTDDHLFITDGPKLRVITDPTTPANSLLTTVFTAASNIRYFILTADQSQVFYTLESDGLLRCHALTSAGTKTWCADGTLGPTTGLGTIPKGPNQMTWKDSNTLLVNNYSGLIFQYSIPQTN